MNTLPQNTDTNPLTPISAGEVLFVDLDGTLIASDMLVESMLLAVKSEPKLLLQLPFALLRGRASLKRVVAQAASPDPSRLPYRGEVIEFIAQQRASGCRIVLATASDAQFAQAVAEHLGIFDDFLASDGQTNLKGPAKLAAIEAYCRQGGYSAWSYVGDAQADVPIWNKASKIYVVEPSKHLMSSVAQLDVPARSSSSAALACPMQCGPCVRSNGSRIS